MKRRLETRPQRFLWIAERSIYGYSRSPYFELLKGVGCELGDLRDLVTREGVEGALAQLAEKGVYVSFDELKGRREIIRGSQRLRPAEENFDNPRQAAHFERWTGGTRGPGTRVKTSLPFVAEQSSLIAVALDAHGFTAANHAVWMTAPFFQLLRYAKLGRPPTAWFHPLKPLPWKVQAAGRYLQALSGILGCRLPGPAWADLREPGPLIEWLAARLADGQLVCLTTYASSAVRIAVAAREGGISLRGVCFLPIGEPFTEAKQQAIAAAEARAVVSYSSAESGIVAYRCAVPRFSDDLHFFSDSYALLQRPRSVGAFGFSVDAFLLTTLLPSAPKILLNVESGDHGMLEQRGCECAMNDLGLRDHLSHICSHEKLSSEGMTFVNTHLMRVLEEVLPRRFGGSSTDYQIIEQEGSNGILSLALLVSPVVGAVDEVQLKQAFLTELARDGMLGSHMASIWKRAGTVRIRREAPLATRAGKILPFHLAKPESTLQMASRARLG